MDYTRQEIDQIVKSFRQKPNKDDYTTVFNWYEDNMQYADNDENYMTCIYLFLLGANIKHRYTEFAYSQHMDWIREIRALVEESRDNLQKLERKAYLDFGTKS